MGNTEKLLLISFALVIMVFGVFILGVEQGKQAAWQRTEDQCVEFSRAILNYETIIRCEVIPPGNLLD